MKLTLYLAAFLVIVINFFLSDQRPKFKLKYSWQGKSKKQKGILLTRMIIESMLVTVLMAALVFYFLFFDISRMSGGKVISKVMSPNHKSTIVCYLHEAALSSDAVRCQLQRDTYGLSRNIYWDYPVFKADVRWTDDHNVIINGHQINIAFQTYDWRRSYE
jgi:Na+-transporting methylmalonyl-CoA/oxaloacetate decarboxylase gamma subunit